MLFSIGINVCIGVYLFGEKYANPEEYAAFWVMVAFFIVFGIYDFTFSIYNTIAKMVNEDWKEGDDIVVSFEYEALPEIPEIDYKKLKLERMVVKADDKDIDESLKNLAENAQNFVTKKGKAADGDQVVLFGHAETLLKIRDYRVAKTSRHAEAAPEGCGSIAGPFRG